MRTWKPRNPAVLKQIKGRQCLIRRPLFRDADRLTFGLGLVGISFEPIVLHCVEVCIYIQKHMMEKKQAVFWEGYKRDGGCFEPLDVPCSIRSLASTNVSYFHFPYTENHYMLDWSLGILHVKYAVIIMQVVLGIPSTQSSRLQWNISLSFVTNAGLTRASASWHTGPNFSSHHQLVHSRVFTCSNENFNTDVDSLTLLFFLQE